MKGNSGFGQRQGTGCCDVNVEVRQARQMPKILILGF